MTNISWSLFDVAEPRAVCSQAEPGNEKMLREYHEANMSSMNEQNDSNNGPRRQLLRQAASCGRRETIR